MSSMSINPCTISDGPSIADNFVSAFWQDASWRLIWAPKTEAYVISQAALRWSRNLLQDRDHRRHLKAVDPTGRLLGYARWELPEVPGVEGMWAEAKVPVVTAEEEGEAEKAFAGADWEFNHAMDVLDEPIAEAKTRLTKGQTYIELDALCVHPDNARKGVGTALVEHGIREATKLGFDIFVHSKDAGQSVYSRLGFELLEHIQIDDSKFGGAGYGAHLMVRRCKGGE